MPGMRDRDDGRRKKEAAPSAPGLREGDGAAFRADRLWWAGPRESLSWDGGGMRRTWSGSELGLDLAFDRQWIAILPGEPELAGVGGALVDFVLMGDEPEDDAKDAAAHVDAPRADVQLGGHVLDGGGRPSHGRAGQDAGRWRGGLVMGRLVRLIGVERVVAVGVVGHGESLLLHTSHGDWRYPWGWGTASLRLLLWNLVSILSREIWMRSESVCKVVGGDDGNWG